MYKLKRFFVICIIIFICAFNVSPCYAMDTDPGVTFGLYHQFDTKSRALALIATMSSRFGLVLDDSGVDPGSNLLLAGSGFTGAQNIAVRFQQYIQSVDINLLDDIEDASSYDPVRKCITYAMDSALIARLKSAYTQFVVYLGGGNALDGDPFNDMFSTCLLMEVDGNYYIPWLFDSQGHLYSKGSYIVPSTSYFDMAKGSNFRPSFVLKHKDGTDFTLTASYDMRVRDGDTFQWIRYNPTNTGPYMYLYSDTVIAGAYIPCYISSGTYQEVGYMSLYSYVVSGTSSSYPDGYRINAITVNNNKSNKVRLIGTGDCEVSCDGITVNDIDNFCNNLNNVTYYYDIDNEGDIFNNYVDNTLVFDDDPLPSYTDPSTWKWPSLSPDGNGGFNFDFNLPDLNIDWDISGSGLRNKFPFSIPFDLLAFFTILNAEPETPHIEGSIPMGVYTWDFNFDLHQFDDMAVLLRNIEFIAFCIGLLISTKNYL